MEPHSDSSKQVRLTPEIELEPEHRNTHERKYSKGNELPRQTVPRAPGAESPALRVTLAAESTLFRLRLLNGLPVTLASCQSPQGTQAGHV